MPTASRFLSFVAPRTTTFLLKQSRPRAFDNNAAEYDGLLCVDTVLRMPGADPAGDADDLLANQEFSIDDHAETDAEYELTDKGAVYSLHSFSANNLEYDNDMRNDAAAGWLRERGFCQLDGN